MDLICCKCQCDLNEYDFFYCEQNKKLFCRDCLKPASPGLSIHSWQCLHLMALTWIASQQYGQVFMLKGYLLFVIFYLLNARSFCRPRYFICTHSMVMNPFLICRQYGGAPFCFLISISYLLIPAFCPFL